MKASAFSYARATSVSNALQLFVPHGDKAKRLAGGQSPLPAMNLRLISPELIVDIQGQTGERRVAAADFFTGIYQTARSPQKLLVAIELPVARSNALHFFHEFARRHGDYAIVGLAAKAIMERGVFTDLRLAFFAVGDRPVLAGAAGKLGRV